jgi:hypothetical protein
VCESISMISNCWVAQRQASFATEVVLSPLLMNFIKNCFCLIRFSPRFYASTRLWAELFLLFGHLLCFIRHSSRIHGKNVNEKLAHFESLDCAAFKIFQFAHASQVSISTWSPFINCNEVIEWFLCVFPLSTTLIYSNGFALVLHWS